MRSTLFAALLLVFVAAVVWLWSRQPDGRPAPSPAETPPEAAAPDPDGGGRPPAAVDPAAVDLPTRVAADAETRPAIPDDAKWIEVLVVDEATDEPVAGAEVWWMDSTTGVRAYSSADLSAEDRDWLLRNREATARRFGWRARADERGIARVHFAGWAALSARHEGRFGSAHFFETTPRPPGGYRVALAQDLEMRVQVVGADGSPVIGMPLGVAQHAADGTLVRMAGWAPVARSEPPDGIALLRHLQQWTGEGAGDEKSPPIADWRVRPHLPGFEETSLSFDPLAPPAEPVVLRLPPFGQVRARVEHDGQAMVAPAQMTRLVLYQGAFNDNDARNKGWWRPADADGWARFGWVPAGGRYAVASHLGFADLYVEFEGPGRQGHEVTVRVPFGADQVVLAGRLLDRDRQLVRDQAASVTVETSVGSGGMSLRTDAQGRFRLFFGRYRDGATLGRLDVEIRREGEPPQRAKVAPRPLRAGTQDVGDVVLGVDDLVVAGTLMTPRGPYTANVYMRVEQHVVDAAGAGAWSVLRANLHRGGQGRFEVRGEAGPGRHRLTFPSSKVHFDPIEFAPGTTDLVVPYDPGSSLRAALLAPPGAAASLRGALVRSDGGPAPPVRAEAEAWGASGLLTEIWSAGGENYNMAWHGVPSGTYALELRAWADAEPVLVIEDVQVPPPEGGDPRLAALDLRDVIEVLRLRFVDPSGAPIEKGGDDRLVFPLGLDPSGDWPAFEMRGDVATVVVRETPVNLLAIVPGFRPVELRGLVAAEPAQQVRLEPWPEVELVFADLPALPVGVTLYAMLDSRAPRGGGRFHTPSSRGSRWRHLRPPSRGTAVVNGRARVVVGDGPHDLHARLRRDGVSGRVSLDGVEPREVVPVAGGIVQVRIPTASVQAALDKLAERAKSK